MHDYNPFSLKGKTILVTGASSGIGKATAIECAKLGAELILLGRNKESLQKTSDIILSNGGVSYWYSVDLNDSKHVDALIKDLPIINGLVNNAGIVKIMPVQFIKEEDVLEVFKTNTVSAILLVKKILKLRKIQNGSSIVFTSSVCGPFKGTVANSIYAISKSGINGYVKCAALELASKQIRVNSVCPGMTDTNIISAGIISDQQYQADIKQYPLARHGKPEEIAHAIIYLLSDASSWVTGTSLIIDGGLTIK